MKKKFCGCLKVLLLFLFIILLGICSTCYASYDEIFTETEISQVNTFFSLNIPLTNYNVSYNFLKQQYPTLNKLNIIFILDPRNTRLYLVPSNNSFNNNLDYLLVYPRGSSSSYFETAWVTSADSSKNVNFYMAYINYSNNTNATYSSAQTVRFTNDNQKITINGNFLSSQLILTTISTASFYYRDDTNYPIRKSYFSSNYIVLDDSIVPEPEEPSGDIPSGDGGLGNITTPSGENGGNINLQPIQQGINNIQNQISGDTQKVIENQNQNTEKIVGAINNSNQNYWGSSGDLTGDSQISDIEDNMNNLISLVSGDLSSNEVILSLESAENGFLDLFRNPHEETWYDLAFEWNDIYLYNSKLVPAGSINISQMCRDITVLGYIQGIIRALFNFGVAISLIKQIYNLILSTLGIDNPYLYEDGTETTLVNMDTGEFRQFYKRRKRRL